MHRPAGIPGSLLTAQAAVIRKYKDAAISASAPIWKMIIADPDPTADDDTIVAFSHFR